MLDRTSTRLTLDDVRGGLRFFVRATAELRRPYDVEVAGRRLQERLAQREANLLAMVRDGVYANPRSPYLRLLDLAGCEEGDLQQLVRQEGVEGACQVLYRRGVYLTGDEAKGRAPVVRGSQRFQVDPSHLHNPNRTADMVAQTGGGRGQRTALPADLRTGRDTIAGQLEKHYGPGRVHATWSVPGSSTLSWIVRSCVSGAAPARWFSLVDPSAPGLHSRYVWSARTLRWAGLLAGHRLPHPELVPLHSPLPIVRWVAEVLRAGQTPCLHTYVSPAVRVCQAAAAAGVELRGAQFIVTGEPTTAARLAAIHRVGASAVVSYGATEIGSLGNGCLRSAVADEVHFRDDSCVLIQPGVDGPPALPPRALLISTLVPTKLVLFNFSTGDEAEVLRRDCGCPLQGMGLTTHLHTIRSFEKLTAGGMTVLDSDVIRVLEEVLPSRFGGGPTDYQLVDGEQDDGAPEVRLLVDPRVGPLDQDEVRRVFLESIGTGGGVDRVTALVWRDAGLPTVERAAPRTTAGGKILHVHAEHQAAARETPLVVP